jgi:hypothetical protein
MQRQVQRSRPNYAGWARSSVACATSGWSSTRLSNLASWPLIDRNHDGETGPQPPKQSGIAIEQDAHRDALHASAGGLRAWRLRRGLSSV